MQEGNTKILTAAQVRELAAASAASGLDRQPAASVLDRLSEETFHIAILSEWNHRRSEKDDAPVYHRVKLLLRTGRSAVGGWLDITDENWQPLPDRDAVLAEVRSQA